MDSWKQLALILGTSVYNNINGMISMFSVKSRYHVVGSVYHLGSSLQLPLIEVGHLA